MKKRICALTLAMCMVMGLAACGGSGGSAPAASNAPAASSGAAEPAPAPDKVYTMMIPHTTNEEDLQIQGWRFFEKTVEEKSGGRIQVDIHPGQTMTTSDAESVQLTVQNVAQANNCPTYSLAEAINVPELFIWDYPYLMQTDEEIYSLLDDPEIGAIIAEQAAANGGLKVYSTFVASWLLLSNSKGEVHAPADLKNLKVRTTTSELNMATVNAWGGSATPMAWGEVYTGLQQKTVDGCMVASTLFNNYQFFNVQDYVTDVNPFANIQIYFINKQFYDSLPADLQVLVDETMNEMIVWLREAHVKAVEEVWKNLEAQGVVVTRLTDEERQLFMEAAQPIWDEYDHLAGEEFVAQVRAKFGR